MYTDKIKKKLKQSYNLVQKLNYIPLFICDIEPKTIDVSNADIICAVLPNTNDLLDGSYIYVKNSKNNIIIMDIRYILEKWIQQDIYYLEILFNENMIINGTCRPYIEMILKMKEYIANIDRKNLYRSIIQYNNEYYSLICGQLESEELNIDILSDYFCKLVKLRNIFKNLVNGYLFSHSLRYMEEEDTTFINNIQITLSNLPIETIYNYLDMYTTKLQNNVFDILDVVNKEDCNNITINNLNCIIRKLLIESINKENNIIEKSSIDISKYDNIYFTSDLHFGHKNILQYENRDIKLGVNNIEEHDQKLIDNWNSIVEEDDLVFILGDLSFYNAEKTNEILKQLKGHKVLIKGNHDYTYIDKIIFDKSQFELITDYLQIKYQGIIISLMHYPILSFDGMYKDEGYIHLFGHIHSTPDYKLPRHSYHIGVDVNNYKPVSIDKCIELAMSNGGNLYNKDLIK